jgi:non-heme chloroperoxidase
MSKVLIGILALLLVLATVPVVIIAFSAPSSPPAMAFMAGPLSRVNFGDVPALEHFQARDGERLQYYAYPASPNKVAVLVHAQLAQERPCMRSRRRCVTPGCQPMYWDIRGHGGSGRRGDIDYIGQIDDDLADFVMNLGPAKSDETRTLVGFSAGAGFTIRFAGVVMAGCSIATCSSRRSCRTLRPNAGGWTNISVRRVVTIAWLDRLGIHVFDGFDVISCAVARENKQPRCRS